MLRITGQNVDADGKGTQQNVFMIGPGQLVRDARAAELNGLGVDIHMVGDTECLTGAVKHATGR